MNIKNNFTEIWCEGVERIKMAQGMVQWWDSLNMVNSLLTSYHTISMHQVPFRKADSCSACQKFSNLLQCPVSSVVCV